MVPDHGTPYKSDGALRTNFGGRLRGITIGIAFGHGWLEGRLAAIESIVASTNGVQRLSSERRWKDKSVRVGTFQFTQNTPLACVAFSDRIGFALPSLVDNVKSADFVTNKSL